MKLINSKILLVLVIVTYVGPSAGPAQDDEDVEVPDSVESQESEKPRAADALEGRDLSKKDDYNIEDSQVQNKKSPKQMLKGNYKKNPSKGFPKALGFLPALKKAKGNPKGELDFKRMIQLPWSKGRPTCQSSTTAKCSSTFSLPPCTPSCTAKTTAAPTKSTPSPPPSTAKPPACKNKSSKGRPKKPKVRPLKPKTAEMLLKIILDTKQHVLFALEIINHMENEVLYRTPDACHRQNSNKKTGATEKGRPMPKKKPAKPQKQAKCQAYNDYRRKSQSSMPMAKPKKLRQKEQLASIAPQNIWSLGKSNQANRVKNVQENLHQPTALKKKGFKKYRNNNQKQQSKLKKIPPGMVSILT